jgi:hypothetical protein
MYKSAKVLYFLIFCLNGGYLQGLEFVTSAVQVGIIPMTFPV